jgi:hypothetical protein
MEEPNHAWRQVCVTRCGFLGDTAFSFISLHIFIIISSDSSSGLSTSSRVIRAWTSYDIWITAYRFMWKLSSVWLHTSRRRGFGCGPNVRNVKFVCVTSVWISFFLEEAVFLILVMWCGSKGKAIPLQAWTGREGSRRLRTPYFKTIVTWRW